VAELPLDRVLQELEALSLPSARRVEREVLDRSILVTETVFRRLGADGCFFRALSRYALLHAHGVEAAFCMGLQPPPRPLVGHAWVQDERGPYLEVIDEGEYVVTFTYPKVTTVD
jgi:hypothetical protein